MAIFEIIEGSPGQGKSLYTARTVLKLLARNRKWYKKSGIKRLIYSNMRFSPAFEQENAGWYRYWSNTADVCNLNDIDLIWDEIATELDARNYANLSMELKRFLSQYRKRGVDIYANTQDFSMIDARARLMVTRVASLTKVLGSPDISTTKPPPKHVWGLVMVREVQNYKETDPEKKKYSWLPGFFFIERRLTDIYDTRQDIPLGDPPPLRHEVRKCEHFGKPGHVDCNYCKVMHY